MSPPRNDERKVVDQEPVAEPLAHVAELDHGLPEPVSDRNEDLVRLVPFLVLVGGELLEVRETGLAFRLPALRVLPYPLKFMGDRLGTGLVLAFLDLEPLFLLVEP